MKNQPLYRMTELEVATGCVGGLDLARNHPNDAREHPLAALREILLPALQRQPCIVAFSGGRDSSAILAVAVDLARREGLAIPAPEPTRQHRPGGADPDPNGVGEYSQADARRVGPPGSGGIGTGDS